VTFYDGSAVLGQSGVDTNNSASFATSALVAGVHTITAAYSGDTNYLASSSTELNEAIIDFQLEPSNLSVAISAGGSTAVTLTVTEEGGLNSGTMLSCSGLPKDATCSFNPAVVKGTGTTTLTIATTGSSHATLAPGRFGDWSTDTMVAFSCLMLLGTTGCQRRQKFMTVLLLLVSLGSILGCGASSSGNNSGTPAGTYPITVAGTLGSGALAITHTSIIQLTVR
jgi:hypothetical protein